VASVKPTLTPSGPGQIGRPPGGRLTATNVPLMFLIQNAYRVRPFQVIGGPDWLATDHWDIGARAPEDSISQSSGPPDPNVPDGLSLRLQALLEDRFKLKLHRETRDLPIFELTVPKGGVKAKLSDDQGPIRPPAPGTPPPRPGGPMPRGNISLMIGGGELHAAAVPFANFVATLSQILGRTVVDKTEMKGLYDFDLKWTPDVGQAVGPAGALPPGVELPPIDPSGPSLVTALQEQLGLKLESSKGPVQVLVIDSVQRPSEN
jgi:bla regulator protein blaR1